MRSSRLAIEAELELDGGPVIHLVFGSQHELAADGSLRELFRDAIRGRLEHIAHRHLGVVLDVLHVRPDDREGVLVDELVDERDAALVGRHLRLEVGEVVLNLARPDAAALGLLEQLPDPLLLEFTRLDELERLDGGAFLRHQPREGRHGAGRDAADIGVVPARRHEKHNLAVAKDGRHHRNVGQVRAARLRVVAHQDVTLLEVLPPIVELPLHGARHGAEVHWHMRSVRDETALRSEKRARKVEPLFDVGAHAGALEGAAHLLRDAHEAVVEDAELHGVDALRKINLRRLLRLVREPNLDA
mmetsp:Transcript_8468/g.28070  ORF Transcript_8468/g.28070 Transcript_8468/m.28070 type:complete len:302 (+) Transcript_8468:937-1842(+)